jgi:MYXO-CTERM domain-containing protein
MHMNSKASRRPLPGAARIASLGTLLLSLACSDKPGLSGAQQERAPASGQALAVQTDLTATSTFASDGGVHSYIATLPPAAVVGNVTQRLEAQWNTNLHSPNQAPIYPQGWSIEYYAGSTKLAREPETPSEWAQVSRVVTTGSVDVEAVEDERQAMVATAEAPVAVVAAQFQGVGTGDGWDVFFDPEYTRVFNIHHHKNDVDARLECRYLDPSKGTCPSLQLTQTSHRSTGRIDAASNRLWHPTVTKDATNPRLAWDCVDLNGPARCATPVLVSKHAAFSNFYNNHVDPVVIGRRMYTLGFTSGGGTLISCLDMATRTECPEIPMPQQGGGVEQSGLAAVGTRLYALAGANHDLDCYDTTTGARCPGWPKAVPARGSPVWAPRSANGAAENICANTTCFALDGSAHTLPPNFTAYLAAHPVLGFTTGPTYQIGGGTSLGTKTAWPYDINPANNSSAETNDPAEFRVACWDMATDAQCSAHFPIQVPYLYTAILDPEDPDCVWTNGDDRIVRNYKISTGTEGCSNGDQARISFKVTFSVPRLSCDPKDRVFRYKTFKLFTPNPGQYTSARVTVRDSNNVAIPAWTGRLLDTTTNPNQGFLDLTGLSTDVAGYSPTFDIAAVGFNDTSVVPKAEFRVTTGTPPQLCWDLAVPPLSCPTQAGLAGNDTAGPQSTNVNVNGSLATNPSNVTPYTPRVLTNTVNANPPNFNNCGGTHLRANVVLEEDGSPVAGARVFLFDSAGNPILDANGQPASALTAADGTVSFPVWGAGYTLRLSGTAAYIPVSATVTAGGSGTTAASGNTVVSNTVTTQVNTPANVRFVVTKPANPPPPPPAPVVTAPTAGSTLVCQAETVLTGTAGAGTNVTAKVNNQPVCTVVANAQGQWSCPAQIAVGTSTITATSTDANGNSSDTAAAVSITRRDELAPPFITGPAATVQGPGVKVTGSAHADATVTVKDEKDRTVCTAQADANGAWQCDGQLSAGPHQLTASASWGTCQSTASGPHDSTVQTEAWFQGGGCTSTGSTQSALMLVLALGGLVGLRRRRA